MYLTPLITCLISSIAVAALAEASGTDTAGYHVVGLAVASAIIGTWS